MTENPGGLRERKKARTRASLREHALRLFQEQGYQATTVEQIAAAADVSPSTFFRYFPTKEDVVLQDGFDAAIFEAFGRQPPEVGPVAALRAALREAVASISEPEWEQIRQGAVLQMTVPEVRARMLDDMSRLISAMAQAMAKRTGRAPDDLAVQTLVGAVFGVMLSVALPFHGTESELEAHLTADMKLRQAGEMFARMDAGLAMLETGLSL
jgi:AcrR family transcriptional regulator